MKYNKPLIVDFSRSGRGHRILSRIVRHQYENQPLFQTETIVLSLKRVECAFQVGNEILPQVEEYKDLGVFFTRASAMMQTLIGAVMKKFRRS